jgi:hypothetical protein
MDLDALFSVPVQSNAELALAIRRSFDELRQRPVIFAAGCGCAVNFTALSVHDFEEALVFHMSDRARSSLAPSAGDAAAYRDASSLDEVLDRILTLDRADTAARCRALLEEISRSIASFARQCSTHGMKAEIV